MLCKCIACAVSQALGIGEDSLRKWHWNGDFKDARWKVVDGPGTASSIFLKSTSNLVSLQFPWLLTAYRVKCNLLSFAFKVSMIRHWPIFPLTPSTASFKHATLRALHVFPAHSVYAYAHLFHPPGTPGVWLLRIFQCPAQMAPCLENIHGPLSLPHTSPIPPCC